MPTVQELGARLDVPVDEVIRMGEMQVQNPTSMLYRAIEDKVGQKFAAIKAHEQKNGGRKAKNRVYVQHAVPSAGRYQLVSAFPQFELVFTGVDKRAAAVAHATFIIIAEYMFSQFKVSHGMVLAYGISVKQVIMRNRTWVHVCVPGHNVRVQADFLRDDRAIIAMLNSARARGKELPLARDYAQGQAHIHCTNPHECDVQAPGGVMLLTATDTNFRQIAFYMRSHKISLQYVSIPGNKHMEMCTAGPFPELDAYVMPSDDGKYISIAYRNCGTLDMTYTYSNYLEIVARTTVVVDGVTYHKEFVNRVQGMLVYKITAITGVFDEEPVPYKSWIEPGYRNKYMVYAPVLKPYGNVKNVADWTVVAHSVDKGLIDDVVDHAMRVKGAKDLSQVIQQRLFTRTSNFALSNQIVTTSDALPLSVFEIVALSVYTTVFMRKFHDGAAVTTLAPQARELASLARSMPTQLVRMYVGTLLGNLVRSMDFVTDTLRALYYDAIGGSDLPMPAFAVCPGFVEYSDVASSNPRFMGWHTCETSDVMGFTNMLPGVKRTVIGLGTSVVSATTSVDESLIAQLCASGEGIIADGRVQFTDTTSLVEVACGVFSAVKGIFSDVPDPEESLGGDVIKATPVKVSEYSLSVPARNDLMYTQVPQSSKARAYSAQASALVERIQEGQDGLVNLGESKFSTNTPMPTSTVPTVVRGHGTEHPIEYLREGIMKIFPSSLVMSTEHFESDRQYSSWDMVAKALLLRLDVSKLSSPQPEHFYKPLLSGHVQPHVKETFNTTLHTMVKRNANTPADADPLDEEFLWENAWSATRKVFYVPGAQEQLDALEYIGPTEEAIREWVAKLDEAKGSRLLGQPDGYSICELIDGASRNHLMLKAKLKPALDAAYATSVKYPQSIQYDPTGKTVAVLSPVIAEKVAREQHILKPNVMIMQGKNIDDVNRFINTFDWRPDARGERYYVEIDYTMYDKSQGKTCANFYLRKCAEFGVLPRLINFIKDHHYRRTVSSMKAGISAVLRDQNPSGAPFTLDRNNDVNMLVIAELLERILEKIEFIVMMGDDITIAVRGEVDITTWETEINRKFNLSLKASLHKHGYICSMDIVHYPSGASAVVPDVIKRSLAFLEQSLKDEDKFEERYVSFRDNMKRICDLQTQHYLCQAIPERMRTYMPTVTGEAIMFLCMAMTGFYESYEAFRSAHASQPTLRYY